MNTITDFVTYSLIVAGILVMTKPGSQGPALVNSLTSGYAKITNSVTGQG
jgi:hypothetical protein